MVYARRLAPLITAMRTPQFLQRNSLARPTDDDDDYNDKLLSSSSAGLAKLFVKEAVYVPFLPTTLDDLKNPLSHY
jgi:hypothetical protein